ncbi:UNVERIFIED_CONTAM: hypothetical protein Sindi_2920500 [Sesamum indicum]
MHAKLAASSTTWTTGLAPLGHISWPKFRRFRWIPALFSIVGRIRDESAVGSQGRYTGVGVCGNGREKAGSWTGRRSISQKRGATRGLPRGVTHPSTTLRPSTLNFGVLMGSGALVLRSDRWDVESSGGRNFAHWWSTPRAAYAREARRELHDVDNWACPVGPHFVAQISPFFGGFRRVFDRWPHFVMSRPWGLRGRYTGVGVCGIGREKAGSWTGRRSISQKRGATRGLPRGSPILRSDRWDVESSGGRNFAHWWSYAASSLCTRSSPRAPRRGQLGLPVGPHFVAQISPFSVDSGAFSIVGRIRDESAVGSHGEIYRGWVCAERSRKSRKLDGGATGGTSNLPGGVTLRTGGATPRAAYAREARRELHDVDNWACPVGPHFVAQISPFSVDSGAFSIVGRIRDESAVGVSGGDIQGLGCAERSRKSRKLDGSEEHFAKRGATRGLPRGSPILVLLLPWHA